MKRAKDFDKITQDELVVNLYSQNGDRLNTLQKFNYAVMYPITKDILNMT